MYVEKWAAMEAGLTQVMHVVRDRLRGAKIELEPARSLKRKLAFIRKAAKVFPHFDAIAKKGITDTCNMIAGEAGSRHDLTHGLKVNFVRETPHRSILARSDDASKPSDPSLWTGSDS